MESPILKQIATFLQEKKRYKRWLAVFMCLALVVGFGTTALLKMRGRAMTHDEKVLSCKLQVHQHVNECYADPEKKELICGYADCVIHKHNDDCYDANGNLVCALQELEAHLHTDECYQQQEALVCGQEESQGHQHAEGCYAKEQGELECAVEEHAHGEECQAEDGTLTCELEEHAHTDECYAWNETLVCQEAESEGHAHTAECNGTDKVLVCQKPELELHVHTKECYDKIMVTPEGEEVVLEEKEMPVENPGENISYRRVCGKLQLEEHTHTQENGCIEIREVLDSGDLLEPQPAAEGQEGEEPVQTAEDGSQPVQTPQDGTEEPKSIVKTFEGEGFKVTAEYKEDAGIPDEAEFRAEQITAESDEAHYAEREAEFKQNLDDENATMKALLKVGFYIGEEEIEPKSPVTLTVQLLGDDGLPEGTPMTIVHFGEESTEKLEGSKAENDTTSFEMESFSEIAIGYGEEDDTTNEVQKERDGTEWVSVDKSFKYKASEAFDIVFNISGTVVLPDNVDAEEDETVSGNGDETEDVEASGNEGETENVEASGNEEQSEDAAISGSESGEEQGAESEGVVEETETTLGEETQEGTDEIVEDESETELPGEDIEQEGTDAGTDEETGGDASAEGGTDVGTDGGTDSKEEVSTDTDKHGLKFVVESLDDEEDYDKVVKHLKKLGKGKELFETGVVSYSLTYGSEEIADLSKCKITAEILPTDNEEDKEKSEIEVMAVELLESGKIDELDSVVLSDEDASNVKSKKISIRPQGRAVGYTAGKTPNPNFTVQYYANLDRLSEDSSGTVTALEIIDTTGGKLPKNNDEGGVGKTKSIYLSGTAAAEPSQLNQRLGVKFDTELTEVYAARKYNYIMAPSVNYFDALTENEGYVLMEVWVLKEGKDPNSKVEGDWDIHIYRENPDDLPKLHFTNREESASADRVYIKDGATIRLVYNTTKNDDSKYDAVFYDYDISSGYTGSDSNFTMQTGKAGINSTLNASKAGQYAFGNQNMSDFGTNKSGKNEINKSNGNGYNGCTFGLVQGVDGENVIFSSGITAPKIFGTAVEEGKTRYADSQLTFKRNGDSYTLHKASANGGAAVENLDKFWWRYNWNESRKLWANSFWPMDGINAKDKKLGHKQNVDAGKQNFQISDGTSKKVYESDEGNIDHNCFFGMYYEVDFELTPEYVGPLEYCFFGDDDMWVFLDGQLVCDVGGVHGSIGEYVNLWDYLAEKDAQGNLVRNEDNTVKLKNPGKKSHTLQLFYTERGASGSTCWMHFTLPSVTSKSPEESNKDYGHLKVNKVVAREDTKEEIVDVDQEFKFTITLKKDGKTLPDDYSYFKYNEGEDEPIEADLIIQDGGTFTLKGGQYIVIRYLPEGTDYTIQEEKYEDYHPEVDSNVDSNNADSGVNGEAPEGTISGTIIKNSLTQLGLNEVTYKNLLIIYELPKTGGLGTNLYTMAGVAAILLGAGLLYRKKFREGRVGGSS